MDQFWRKGKIVLRVTLGRDERRGRRAALRFLIPAASSFGATRFPAQNDTGEGSDESLEDVETC